MIGDITQHRGIDLVVGEGSTNTAGEEGKQHTNDDKSGDQQAWRSTIAPAETLLTALAHDNAVDTCAAKGIALCYKFARWRSKRRDLIYRVPLRSVYQIFLARLRYWNQFPC